jgi:hypothetical protein
VSSNSIERQGFKKAETSLVKSSPTETENALLKVALNDVAGLCRRSVGHQEAQFELMVEQRNQTDTLIRQNAEQKAQIDALIAQNASQKGQIDTLLVQNASVIAQLVQMTQKVDTVTEENRVLRQEMQDGFIAQEAMVESKMRPLGRKLHEVYERQQEERDEKKNASTASARRFSVVNKRG